MPNVTSWFERIISFPQVVKRLGKVKLCQKPIKPIFPPKEEKKAEKPKPKAEEGEEEEPKKKEVNPLDVLPPTTFDLYNFKTFFVNNKDKKGEGMKTFWE